MEKYVKVWEVEGTSPDSGDLKQTEEILANADFTWASNGFDKEKLTFHGGSTYKKTEESSSDANAIQTQVKNGSPKTLQGVYTKIRDIESQNVRFIDITDENGGGGGDAPDGSATLSMITASIACLALF